MKKKKTSNRHRRPGDSGKSMIVKVQLSEFPPGGGEMLVYNEDRSITFQSPTPPEIFELMGGAKKLFFHARMEGTEICIDKPAPWQQW